MSDLTLADVAVGDRVRAFHPATLGVIYHGTVVTVGRKWVHVDFGTLLGGRYRVAPCHVVEVVERSR